MSYVTMFKQFALMKFCLSYCLELYSLATITSREFKKWAGVMLTALSPLNKWNKYTKLRKTMPVDLGRI